jgi:hypothetical protein
MLDRGGPTCSAPGHRGLVTPEHGEEECTMYALGCRFSAVWFRRGKIRPPKLLRGSAYTVFLVINGRQ